MTLIAEIQHHSIEGSRLGNGVRKNERKKTFEIITI